MVGTGRTSLVLKAAAMRLIRLFMNVLLMNVLLMNKTSTPAIQANDLLLAGSGPGTSSTIVKAAKKAAAAGTISTAADSPLGP